MSPRTYPRSKNIAALVLFLGDIAVCLSGLLGAYFLRFHTALAEFGPTPSRDLSITHYLPLVISAVVFLVGSYYIYRLYDARVVLRPLLAADRIVRATVGSFVLFLCLSYLLKFEPSISRFFTGIAFLSTLISMISWRTAFSALLNSSEWSERLTQRVLLVGWTVEAQRFAEAINHDPRHAFRAVGVLTDGKTAATIPKDLPQFGSINELEQQLKQRLIDVVIQTEYSLPRETIFHIAKVCERNHVDFKIVPSGFQVFLSGLRMQTVAGVPMLGVEALPLSQPFSQLTKRLTDIVGSIIGLSLSAPAMMLLALLIRREDPGPVIYRQIRTGRHGQPFTIYKLRSMRLNAEESNGAQWAVENDPRRLRLGAIMREWNLDELPQFWNVLKGDMSLVGPRPERPELITRFEDTIANYHSRHAVRPGLTGWAQVNGLRGNTSLAERIRHDIFYIENWSLWFDFQIMFLTFLRRKNAY